MVNAIVLEKIKSYFTKKYTYLEIIHLLKKKHGIDIPLRTFGRILKVNDLRRKNMQESDKYKIAVAIMMELEGSGRNLGYRAMWQRLHKVYGLTVRQKTVLALLNKLDPEGVAARLRHRLKRRVYRMDGPSFL